jgi:glutamyl-tRNA(Gln) amidotransferase subunit E
MPAYGITSEEVKKLIQFAKAEESDAVVFVADSAENAQDALEAVVERAREAIVGVPEETRAANPDGTTHFMRPRPGAARMYPETDIPPMVISDEFLGKIKAQLPEPLPLKFQRLVKEYALNEKLAKQLLDSEYFELFETSVRESGVSPTVVVAFLTETLKALKREGVEVEGVRDELIKEIFKGVGSGKLAKEAVSDVFAWLAKHEDKTVEEAIASLGFKAFSEKELEEIIDTVITNNQTMIHKLGKNAFGAVMGMVMKEVRGRANAVLVGELLRKKLDSLV